MCSTSNPPGMLWRFDLVSRSFLAQPGLPFADALPAERIEQAFAEEAIDFASSQADEDDVVYTPAVTLWAFLSAVITQEHQQLLVQLRLEHMASHRIGHRPNRIEPRAIKRRPKPHDLLTEPRDLARAKLLAGPVT